MKKTWAKRVLSVLVSCSTIATSMGIGASTALFASADSDTSVLFSSSFEDNDGNQFLASTVDTKDGVKRTQNVTGSTAVTLTGDVTSLIDQSTLTHSRNCNGNEICENLFDGATASKWLTDSPSSSTIFVQFKLTSAQTIRTYAMASANDSPGRDPKDWTLSGSSDGNNWTTVDTRSGETFSDRFTQNVYKVATPGSYSYYKLSITANNGDGSMTQFSELQIGTGDGSGSGSSTPMITQISNGPASVINNMANVGWEGSRALSVSGLHQGSGEAYCYNVIYDNLSIPVTDNTQLNYMIFPAFPKTIDNYDFNYTSSYLSVDLHFTDGTYLSELGAKDQNGFTLTPSAQGDSNSLYMQQWNNIYSTIGSVAKGKTIDKILVGYDKPDNKSGDDLMFLDYIDNIKIQNVAPVTHDHLSDWVDTRRGTNDSSSFSRGLIAPLVTTPHGFNQFIPVTNDGSLHPYVYQLNGNQNTMCEMQIDHFASNWVGDYGSWQFMPNSTINPSGVTSGDNINTSARAASFQHANETAHAHYYSVTFDKGSKASGVKMEVTPTDHAAYTRFTFDSSDTYRNLIFDCTRANGSLTFNDVSHSFSAYTDHTSDGSSRMYIYGVFDQPYASAKVVNGKQGIVNFSSDTGTVTMKIATSFLSLDQAKKNLALEISDSDTFDSIEAGAQSTWDSLLGKVEVEGASADQMTTLYSNMYRLFAYPMLYSENTGTSDNPVWQYASPYGNSSTDPTVKSGKLYTVNGFWDTYRTCWPAYALLTPNEDTDLLNGLIQHFKDQDWIPRWIAPGGADSMVGTSSDIIFGDAAAKGIQFDMEDALKASLKNGSVVSGNLTQGGRRGLEVSVFKGYTPKSFDSGFSWAMEGYISDFGISQLASKLGKTDEATYYLNRSENFVNLYNKTVGFFMGKNADGTFPDTTNFNPASWWGDYTETNSWVMSFYTPQDFNGLANLYGGKAAAAEKLDELFNSPNSDTSGGGVHEEREARQARLGQDQQSNQPSHDLPYIYDYLGQPYKTQAITRDILSRLYVGSSIGQGYLGDEDNGEQSAWYLFNALGFYPSSIGTAQYAITSPLFTKATIHLENGKDIVINAPNNSSKNKYIQSLKLNGQTYTKTYLNHSDLINGATLDFDMGSEPSAWGTADDDAPTSITSDSSVPNPEKDLTAPTDAVASKAPTGDVTSDTVYATGTSNTSDLFNDNSTSDVTLGGSSNSIYFTSASPKTVAMYTLTSGSNPLAAPDSFTLYGSNDGANWKKLDSRSGETFTWAKYTRPFTVSSDEQGAYTHYRLDLSSSTGSSTLSEVELLGPDSNPKLPQYVLTATSGEHGSISPADSTTVDSGASQTFTFTPDSGYQLDSVTVDGQPVAVTDNQYTVSNVTASHTIAATFKPLQYTLTVQAGAGGTVSPSGTITVSQGDSQAFTFTPDSGYQLDSVTVDGQPVAVTDNQYTVSNVTASHTIAATFKPLQYTLTVQAGAGGTVSPSGKITVSQGDSQTLTFTPDSGYQLDSVTVDGQPVAVTDNRYTLSNVTASHTIAATFKPLQYTLTVQVGAGGTVSPSGKITVSQGDSQTLTFTPDSGYQLDSVKVDGQPVTAENGSYTLTNLTSDHTVSVTFKAISSSSSEPSSSSSEPSPSSSEPSPSSSEPSPSSSEPSPSSSQPSVPGGAAGGTSSGASSSTPTSPDTGTAHSTLPVLLTALLAVTAAVSFGARKRMIH